MLLILGRPIGKTLDRSSCSLICVSRKRIPERKKGSSLNVKWCRTKRSDFIAKTIEKPLGLFEEKVYNVG